MSNKLIILNKSKELISLQREEQERINELLDRVDSIKDPNELKDYLLFVQEYKQNYQLNLLQIQREEEKLLKRIQERKLQNLKQFTLLILGIILCILGPLSFLYFDKDFGVFLTAVGFTSLGVSSNVVTSLIKKVS